MASIHSGNIEPKKLDLVMRDADFVVYYDHQPLETQKGFEIAHHDSRLLKHILIKLTLAGQINHQSINSFSIFSFCKDFIEQNSDPLKGRFDELIKDDILLKAKLNPGQNNRIFNLEKVLDYIEENSQMMHLMFWGVSVIMKGFQDFFSEMPDYKTITKSFPQHSAEVIGFIQQTYNSLACEKMQAW